MFSLRCREDPLTQTPYFALDLRPVNRPPIENLVLRSVHHRGQPAVAPNLSFGSVFHAHRCLTGSPDPRQHPFGPGHKSRIRPVIRDDRRRASPDVPVSCRLSATGIRFPGHPTLAGGLGLPYGRLTRTPPACGTPSRFPRSTRTRYDRGGCLLYPGGGGAHPADKKSPTGACRFPAASPYTPLQLPIQQGSRITRHQTEVHSRSPVRSAPCP